MFYKLIIQHAKHHSLDRICDLSIKCSKESSLSNLSCSFQHLTTVVKVQLSLASHLNLKLLYEQVKNDIIYERKINENGMKLTAVACLCVSPFLE